jgi:hypothetical protein
MKSAVIVCRLPGGAQVAGEACDSIADLMPKAAAIAKAGRLGKQVIDKVQIVSTWQPPRVYAVEIKG